MEADRVIAIATDPSTASTFDVGRLAARVLHLEQSIVAHRNTIRLRDVHRGTPAQSANETLWQLLDVERCRHDAETAAGGGWVCDQCGEATHAATS